MTEEVVCQRPLPLADWDELVGHGQERERLARTRGFSSLLFSGPQGLGKKLVAAWYAALLNCQQPRAQAPWNCTCPNCRLVLRNAHPDLVWLERAPGKLSLGVGEARELIHQLYLRPYQAQQRVCIISEAERLTEEAQSALLKTLEEPPDSNCLILVTHQESRLLPTVQSRCRITRFRPLEEEEMHCWLERLGCPAESARNYSSLSQGCPGIARQFWEQPQLWESLEQLLDILQELPGSSLGRCLELAGRCETLKIPGLDGRNLLEWVLERIQAYYRDLLLLQCGSSHISHLHRLESLQQRAAAAGSVQGALEDLREAREYCQANVNQRLLLQNLFLKLRRA